MSEIVGADLGSAGSTSSTSSTGVAASANGVDPGRQRTHRAAGIAGAVFALGLVVVVGVSAFRIAGFDDLGLRSDQLSGRYLRELLLWVPTVMVLAAGMFMAALVRTKNTD